MKPRSFTEADAWALVGRLQLGRTRPVAVRLRPAHSNHVAEVEFDSGRTLVIKQTRYAEMTERLETSRMAARLLREQARLRVPEYLDLPGPEGRGTLVYWHIPLPPLEWPWAGLRDEARRNTLRSWGELIGRIQQVRLPGHGALLDVERRPRSLAEFLQSDLLQRLRPAAVGEWPAAISTIDELAARAERIQARVGDGPAVLVHNDLFASNILCEQTTAGVLACVGAIDFEDAFAGPPEAELAKVEVLHGPLFGQPRDASFLREIVAGYGGRLDPQVTAYFRVFHLLNMGFHAALTGLDDHAADVLAACRRELGRSA